jgi:hypothetical protein
VPLLPPGDVETLAAFLIGTQMDGQPLHSSARALQNRIRERFTVATMVNAVMAFYADLAALGRSVAADGRLAVAAE